MNESKESFLPFISGLSGIRDRAMRMHRLLAVMQGLTSDRVALLIEEIIEGNCKGRLDHKAAYLALAKARDLSRSLGYDKVSNIYICAKEKGLDFALEFLKTYSAIKTKGDVSQRSHLAKKLMHLTLGEKKAYARRKDFKHLEFLLYDSDPSVIGNLLMNPRITEKEVIRIAANKATNGKVLEEIFKNDRWLSNYRVKKALVFNANTPIDISLNLCSLLLSQDLRFIIRDGMLDRPLIERAKKILADKKR